MEKKFVRMDIGVQRFQLYILCTEDKKSQGKMSLPNMDEIKALAFTCEHCQKKHDLFEAIKLTLELDKFKNAYLFIPGVDIRAYKIPVGHGQKSIRGEISKDGDIIDFYINMPENNFGIEPYLHVPTGQSINDIGKKFQITYLSAFPGNQAIIPEFVFVLASRLSSIKKMHELEYSQMRLLINCFRHFYKEEYIDMVIMGKALLESMLFQYNEPGKKFYYKAAMKNFTNFHKPLKCMGSFLKKISDIRNSFLHPETKADLEITRDGAIEVLAALYCAFLCASITNSRFSSPTA